VLGHLTVVDDVNVSAATLVTKSIERPGTYTGAMPFEQHRDWLRNAAHLRHLDELSEKVRALEARLVNLEKKS
jgi:UDP-3-O-[3-hydroxymyristoyl] glucosamine N-acyltransferase